MLPANATRIPTHGPLYPLWYPLIPNLTLFSCAATGTRDHVADPSAGVCQHNGRPRGPWSQWPLSATSRR